MSEIGYSDGSCNDATNKTKLEINVADDVC